VFFQEQPGNVDVPVLDSIHKGSDSTFVSAVRFVLAPGREDKIQDRVVGSSKTLTAPVALHWWGRRLPADVMPEQAGLKESLKDGTGHGIYKACPQTMQKPVSVLHAPTYGLLGFFGSETW